MRCKMKRRSLRILVGFLCLWIAAASTACLGPYAGDACVCCINSPHPMLGGVSASEPSFEWIPDGSTILLRNMLGEIHQVVVNEVGISQSVPLAGITGYRMDISEDGRLLAVSTAEQVVNVFTLPAWRLAESIPFASHPAWRPHSQMLAIESLNATGTFYIVELLEFNDPLQRVTVAGSQRQIYDIETWSPNGDYLALSATDPDPVAAGLADKLYVSSMKTGEIEPLAELQGCQRMLAWSPSRNQIVFAANPDFRWDLFEIELGRNEVRNLINTPSENEYQPAWSPDGRSLAYVAFKPTSDTKFEQDIYVLDLVTLERRRLTYTPDEHESLPLWSPDGSRIAYLSVQDNNWYLSILNRDGSGKRRLVEIGGTP